MNASDGSRQRLSGRIGRHHLRRLTAGVTALERVEFQKYLRIDDPIDAQAI